MNLVTPSSPPAPSAVTALVLGAGMGLRMGMGPKAFLTYSGETLLERAATAVATYASEIVIGVRAEDEAKARALFAGKPHKIAVGGATRQETVSRLLRHATRAVVLIHEVARPFVPAESFERILAAAAESGAAALYLPLEPRDSLATMEGRTPETHTLGEILPRARVVTMQTPHAYRRDVLLAADDAALKNHWKEDGTAALVRRAGHAVRLVLGSPENIKLTYPKDAGALKTPASNG